MQYLLAYFIAFILMLIPTTGMLQNFYPDWIIFALWFSLSRPMLTFIAAIFLGLSHDIIAGVPLGHYVLLYLLLAGLGCYYQLKFDASFLPRVIILCALYSCLNFGLNFLSSTNVVVSYFGFEFASNLVAWMLLVGLSGLWGWYHRLIRL